MIWLWILGVILALILLLCVTRVGARVMLTDGTLAAVDVKVGLFQIRVFPGKEKSPKKEAKQTAKREAKKAKKATKKAADTARSQTETKKKPKITLEDIKDAVRTLWPPLKRALSRLGRGIRIDPLNITVTVGGREDPAGAAQLYGYINAGIWTAMPELEKLMDIPDPSIRMRLDFDASKTIPAGEIGVSIRVGTVLAMAFGVGIPALRWFLRLRKKMKTQQQTAPQKTAEQTAA